MEKSNRVGLVRVTYELLEDLLKISGAHKVIDIYATAQDRQNNQFRVKIIGPNMPEKIEGSESMIISVSDIAEANFSAIPYPMHSNGLSVNLTLSDVISIA